MKTLFLLEIQKIKNYRTFKALVIIYVAVQLLLCSSWQYYIEFIAENSHNRHLENILKNFRLYHFHDIWHNLTYVSGYLKFILAVFVLTSICNEISYRTIRQNVIDGLSRFDFLKSKIGLILMLSIGSTLLVFLQGSILGLIYTPIADYHYFFWDSEFLLGFLLESIFFYMLTFFIGLSIKRTGLSMIVLFVYVYIAEPIISLNIPNKMSWVANLMPIRAMNNLNEFPFKKYAMMMSKEYIALNDVMVVGIYTLLFAALSYLVLRRSNL